jgi:hypothetical protein
MWIGASEHAAQCLNYLRSGLAACLLMSLRKPKVDGKRAVRDFG